MATSRRSRSTRTTLALAGTAVFAAALVTVAAAQPASADKPGSGTTTGTGQVFKVNPVQSSGNQDLTDMKDSDAAVPRSEYAQVQLRNLDGSGYLHGKWVTVRSSTGAAAYSPSNTFVYTRHADQFEQVMAYFWVDRAQEYLQSLGFGSTLPPANAQQQEVRIDQYGVDNSFFNDARHFDIRFGKGGMDDAEDAEVIVHEYGHAVHASQVPGFGSSLDAGSIGEAFGDYLGVTVGLDAAQKFGWPVRTPLPCVADWDSVSYTSTTPHCLRRLDTNITVAERRHEVHYDGQIWSRALWDIRNEYLFAGKTAAAWDTTLIDSQFRYAPDTSFSAAAKATYETVLERDGAGLAFKVKTRFAERGITF
jgi:hypothetical protein